MVAQTKDGLPTLLSVEELSEYLGVPVDTIYRWRMRGIGPRGTRVGRYVRFLAADVEAWLATRAEV